MFRKIFGFDSDLMIVMGWITDAIFLSLFWLLGCALAITAGASATALYDSVFYAFRKRNRHSWGRFWKTYFRNLKASLLPTVVCSLVCIGVGYVDVQLWNNAVAEGNWLAFAVVAVISLVVLGMVSVLFPMLSRFENSFGRLLGNTVRIALANMPRTVLLGVLYGVTIFACARWVIPVFILPALAALLSSCLVEPMFKPYLPADFYEIISED
jgi:uncharacterized membrane protein YesL